MISLFPSASTEYSLSSSFSTHNWNSVVFLSDFDGSRVLCNDQHSSLQRLYVMFLYVLCSPVLLHYYCEGVHRNHCTASRTSVLGAVKTLQYRMSQSEAGDLQNYLVRSTPYLKSSQNRPALLITVYDNELSAEVTEE